jgi:hypothetical protein
MALVDLKSNLANYRANFNIPPLETKVNDSIYNIDDQPKKYGNDANQSRFKDISGTNFNYPSLLINGKRLMQPAGTKNSRPVITFPGPQNFLNDSAATGFTLETFKPGQSKKDTQFKSYFNYTDFKKTYIIPDTKSTGPTGWQPGNSTLISQLGTGIPNLIKSYDSLITNTYNWYTPGGSKNAYHSGFHNGNRYSDAANINSITERGFLAAMYNTNSPIDDVYKKYNLQDEAFNPSYIKQPYIVRGIQRKGNETPQYWGFGSKSGFDDGLIRGGAIGAAKHSISDTLRIGKFLTDAPHGPLFIAKQVGLQLSNPKIETKAIQSVGVGGLLGRIINTGIGFLNKNEIGPTRIYNLGINTIAQVPVNAFGGHFNRHGLLPVQTDDTKYIKVAAYNNTSDQNRNPTNKLIKLKDKLVGKDSFGVAIDEYIGGPGSTYGIGSTLINRYTTTRTESQGFIDKTNPYQIQPTINTLNYINLSNNSYSIFAPNYFFFEDNGDIALGNTPKNLNNRIATDKGNITNDKDGTYRTKIDINYIRMTYIIYLMNYLKI